MICREAIAEVFEGETGVLTTNEVIERVYAKHPDRPWQKNTIQVTLTGLSINHPSSRHHPNLRSRAFLFSPERGRYRRWDPGRDGEWAVVENRVQRVNTVETVVEKRIQPVETEGPEEPSQTQEIRMSNITEVIKLRIDSLEHTRQLVAVLAGSLTAVYTAIGIFSANQGILLDSSQSQASWLDPAWNFFVVMLLVTVGLTNLCFVLGVFLLTDSIHNYSKILEYRHSDLFASAESEAALAHQRALTSDDLSYFYVRVGTFFIAYNMLLAVLALMTRSMQPLALWVVLAGVLVCGLVAFLLVLSSYRVSHYKVPEHPFGKAVARFWNPCRWRNAARGSGSSPTEAIKNSKQ